MGVGLIRTLLMSPAGQKAVNTVASFKLFVLAVSTLFFYIGKIDQQTWKEMAMAIAGLHALVESTSIVKTGSKNGLTPGAKKASRK